MECWGSLWSDIKEALEAHQMSNYDIRRGRRLAQGLAATASRFGRQKMQFFPIPKCFGNPYLSCFSSVIK